MAITVTANSKSASEQVDIVTLDGSSGVASVEGTYVPAPLIVQVSASAPRLSCIMNHFSPDAMCSQGVSPGQAVWISTYFSLGEIVADGGTRPVDGGVVPFDGGVVPFDGGVVPFDGGTRPVDGGTRPVDGGTRPVDGGTRPVDGGTRPVDGGTRPVDGGTRPVDGGTRPVDGGTRPVDGGVVPFDGGVVPFDGGVGAVDVTLTDNCGGPMLHLNAYTYGMNGSADAIWTAPSTPAVCVLTLTVTQETMVDRLSFAIIVK